MRVFLLCREDRVSICSHNGICSTCCGGFSASFYFASSISELASLIKKKKNIIPLKFYCESS
jgi:hypothetical protein